eukprot:Awhi_evm1s921
MLLVKPTSFPNANLDPHHDHHDQSDDLIKEGSLILNYNIDNSNSKINNNNNSSVNISNTELEDSLEFQSLKSSSSVRSFRSYSSLEASSFKGTLRKSMRMFSSERLETVPNLNNDDCNEHIKNTNNYKSNYKSNNSSDNDHSNNCRNNHDGNNNKNSKSNNNNNNNNKNNNSNNCSNSHDGNVYSKNGDDDHSNVLCKKASNSPSTKSSNSLNVSGRNRSASMRIKKSTFTRKSLRKKNVSSTNVKIDEENYNFESQVEPKSKDPDTWEFARKNRKNRTNTSTANRASAFLDNLFDGFMHTNNNNNNIDNNDESEEDIKRRKSYIDNDSNIIRVASSKETNLQIGDSVNHSEMRRRHSESSGRKASVHSTSNNNVLNKSQNSNSKTNINDSSEQLKSPETRKSKEKHKTLRIKPFLYSWAHPSHDEMSPKEKKKDWDADTKSTPDTTKTMMTLFKGSCYYCYNYLS